MVGLRERKARPSYSNIPAGLENLSDSDDDGSKEDGAGPSRKKGTVPDDDASMSSGDESEFDLEAEKERGTRGKQGEPSGSRSGSEDDELDSENASEEGSEVVVEPDDDSIVDLNELDAPRPPWAKGGRGNKKPRPAPTGPLATPTGLSRSAYPRGATNIYSQTGINLIPPAYRELIKESAKVLAKLPVSRAGGAKETYRGFGWELYPAGPCTPWVTRLREDGTVKVGKRVGGMDEWKKRAKRIWSETTIYTPQEAWEGEAWFSEMYNPGGMDVDETPGAGPSLPRGWKWRDEVRLGLDDVGRYAVGELEVLSERQAAEYVPKFADKFGASGITVHLGPHGKQAPESFYMFQTTKIENHNVDKSGYYFAPGGPIWGMDWCPYPDRLNPDGPQYLAVSTFPSLDTHPAISDKWPRDSKASIQIWSVMEPGSEGGMKCEMVLCIEGGQALAAKWMPLGAWDKMDDAGKLPKLGILALAQLDGSVSLYSVPHPRGLRDAVGNIGTDKPIFVKLPSPHLRLDVPDASCLCIDWMTGTKLVAGLSNGHIVIWDVGHALRSGEDGGSVLPSACITVTSAPVRAVHVARIPPGEDEKHFDYTSDPAYIVYGSYDGTLGMLDTRDLYHPVELSRQRVPCLTVAWSSQAASPLAFEIDYALIMRKIRGIVTGRSHPVSLHRGPGWDIGTSDYHAMIASGGSDGALIVSSVQGGFGRPRKAPLLYHRLYEVDYDVHNGEYRILDDFLPETISLEAASGRKPPGAKVKPKPEDDSPVKTAAWQPHVGVHKAVWNNAGGIGRAGWLVSGMGCGLGRVDFVKGRWRGGTIPYDLA